MEPALPAAALCVGPSAGAAIGSRQTAAGGRAGEGTSPVPGRPPWQRLPRSAALINAGPWLERPPAAQLRPVICRSLFLHPRLLKSVFPHTGSGPQVMGKTHRLRPPRGPPGFLPPPPEPGSSSGPAASPLGSTEKQN